MSIPVLGTVLNSEPVKAASKAVSYGLLILMAGMALMLVLNPDAFYDFVTPIINAITGFFSAIVNGFKSAFNWLINGIIGIGNSFVNGIKSFINWIFNAVINFGQKIIDKITNGLGDIDWSFWN